MATEEIQISQLELAQEVQGDMVFAVDTATDTKSLSVNQLKNHISQPLQANINAVDASALHKYNISNCITEIPQDIRIEIVNGVAKLMAGSKIYVPNGFTGTTPKFDVVTIEADRQIGLNTPIGQYMVFWKNTEVFGNQLASNCLSGNSVPSSFQGMYYNTDTNNLDFYVNSTAEGSNFSLPLALITTANGSIISIDKIFNGFSRIGSTLFALQGVKGLISNGTNTDSTLKNIELANTSVFITTFSSNINYTDVNVVLSTNGIDANPVYAYNEQTNYVYNKSTKVNYNNRFIVGKISISSGVITSFTPKTPFHAVDYNDFEKAMLKEDWVKVSTVPASPDPDKFYYIPEN